MIQNPLNIEQGNDQLDLILVMPVYNEQDCIAAVLGQWNDMLENTVSNYRIIAINDGSTDNTRSELKSLENHSRIQVIHKANSGHGPTILVGYQMAVRQARWVFQVDSDNEMSPDHFPGFWQQRDAYDFLYGVRSGRRQNASRLLITSISRLAVRLLFGKGVQDVNTPYRLMRAEALAVILPHIRDDIFAPNIIISGLSARKNFRIGNIVVTHEGRKTGATSIARWSLWKNSARALIQTIIAAARAH